MAYPAAPRYLPARDVQSGVKRKLRFLQQSPRPETRAISRAFEVWS